MSSQYDAIIIGAGIIGGAIGLELARTGARTLNVDRLPAAGYGSATFHPISGCTPSLSL